MATFQQKLGTVKESLASLFKNRSRRRSLLHIGGTDSGISAPQNVKRVMHITFDEGRKSFDGIPSDWRQYFDAAATVTEVPDEPASAADDDSGVSMATGTTPAAANREELLTLTYDRDAGRFVDLPAHWQDRLERNNLLEPEFQKNPDLLVTVFALMDEELKAMQLEGFKLEKGLFSSSPINEDQQRDCPYFYEIEADHSNSSSEQNLQTRQTRQCYQPSADVEELAYADDSATSFNEAAPAAPRVDEGSSSIQLRQPSLVRLRAVAALRSPTPTNHHQN